jgi:hypothetical protein
MNLETRIYQALLKLYPRAFRQEYSEEMTRVFQESLQQEGSSFGFWIGTFWDVISSATAEHAGREHLPTKKSIIYLGGASLIALGVFDTLLASQVFRNDPLSLNRLDASGINLMYLLFAFFGLNALFALNRSRTVTHHFGLLVVRLGVLLEAFYVLALFVTQWLGKPMLTKVVFGNSIGQLTESDSMLIHAIYSLGNAANEIAYMFVLLGLTVTIINQFLQDRRSFKKLSLEWKLTLTLIAYSVLVNAYFWPTLRSFFDFSGRAVLENQTFQAIVFLQRVLPNVGACCLGIAMLLKGSISSNPPRIEVT